ncbi:MAG TPA: FAD-dependent oxidoreductase, partial [Candidatus Omnitrophota bacterium]|nr:FAD-dependent oxidoreductase [Candidatus Omnitrophota bacterium]
KSGFDLVGSRLKGFRGGGHFESFAIYTYGREMAQRFLLNYSQKLWGFPCDQLSPQVSGKRMKGLNLKTFLKEAFSGHKEKTEHLDGTFYYPKFGYGMIAERLADYGGRENIKLNTRVTKVFHSANKIDAIEVNGKDRIETRDMVNTLPLSIFLTMMEPKLPQDILKIVQDMRFRHVILVAVFINKKNVTPNGSVYFPDPDFPFTRVYEPRNRSIHMAPEGKTSLVAEIPCFGGDALWQKNEIELTRMVKDKLIEVGWVDEEEIIGSRVYRLYNAYPVLALGFEERIEEITLYLDRFSNLEFSGRGGKFVYAWLHDMMQFGKDIIEEYAHA